MIENLKELISKGESINVEFKTRLVNEKQIATILTAFANTLGGYLFIGVGDNSEILGLPEEECLRVRERLNRICKSLFSFFYQTNITNIDGRSIVYAYIEKAPEHLLPISTGEGQTYKRDGERITKFKRKTFSIKTNEVNKSAKINGFIAMSFRNEEEPALIDYYYAMLRAVEKSKLPITLNRMDLEDGDYEISQEIMNKISKSQFIIADFTLNSRNVYFEIGFARGKGIPIIQTSRKDTDLQFDIRNWKTLFYRNATELEEKLVTKLKKVYKDITEK